MALNGNSDETNGYNSVIKNGTKTDANLVKSVIPPIGTILAWLKSQSGTPSLPDGWVECSGQTLSDADSPYDGVTIPDLNGNNHFLRGNSTSGGTGGSLTHNHQWANTTGNGASIDIETSGGTDGSYDSGGSVTGFTNSGNLMTGNYYTDNDGAEPPYTNVVWIIRVK